VPSEKEFSLSLEWWAGWAPVAVWRLGVVKNIVSCGNRTEVFWSRSAYVGIYESDRAVVSAT